MTIVSGFADISIFQLLLVAVMALFASIIGGLAGYGTGALMPLVLVPLVGALASGGLRHRWSTTQRKQKLVRDSELSENSEVGRMASGRECRL